MTVLAINTALFNTTLALFRKEENKYLLVSEKKWESKKNEAEKLLNNINELLKENNLDLKDIEEVFAVSGPGSFTGLRVGLVTANTISYLNSCPIKEVNTFEYLWKSLKANKKNTALILFAGAKGIYLHDNEKTSVKEVRILNINEAEEVLNKYNIKKIFGEINSDQKNKLSGFEFVNFYKSFGETVEEILNEKLSREGKSIKPLYIKKPQITKAKKSV